MGDAHLWRDGAHRQAPLAGRLDSGQKRGMDSVSPTFEQLAERGDDIDVALGAALLARDVYGSLDVPRLLERFDELARPLLGLGLGTKSAREQAKAVSTHLYETLGF